MNREEGFYWVQFEDEPWEVAQFKSGRWLLIGVDDSNTYHDKDFLKISEEKLERWNRKK